jgi:hypothetical protein
LGLTPTEKLFAAAKQIRHARPGSNDVVIAINRFEIFVHAFINVGFEIFDFLRGATVKVVVNLIEISFIN